MSLHSIRQFPLHFPSLASPCAITFQLDSMTNLSPALKDRLFRICYQRSRDTTDLPETTWNTNFSSAVENKIQNSCSDVKERAVNKCFKRFMKLQNRTIDVHESVHRDTTMKINNKMHYIDSFIIPSRLYMFRAMFSPIIRRTWLYLQYLVLFTKVAAGWCPEWVENSSKTPTGSNLSEHYQIL